MDEVTVPAGSPDALDLLESLMRSLAGTDPTELADEERRGGCGSWSGSLR